jgi:hypothetical protein
MSKKKAAATENETELSGPEDIELPALEGMDSEEESSPRKQDDGPDDTEVPVDREAKGGDKDKDQDEPPPPAGPPLEPQEEALPLHELGSWNEQDRAELAKAPRRVQEVVLKREREMFEGIKQFRDKAQAADTVAQIIQPYLPTIRSEGLQVEQWLQNLAQTYYEIRQDPYGTIQRLAQATGVDLARLAPSQGQAAPQQDPMLQQIIQKVGGLERTVMQTQEQYETAQRAKAQMELAAFSADKANEFFSDSEVQARMAESLRTGYARDIKHAYELACWDIPRIRVQAERRRQSEAEAKRISDAKTKAKTARLAAQDPDVFGQESSPQTSDSTSLYDHLSKNYDRLSSGGRL